MHLSDRELELVCDGETLGDGEDFAHRHLASCAACARALDDLRWEDASHAHELTLLDHAVPRVSVEALMARARTRPRRRTGLLAASVGFLVIAGTAAAALPGSPVRAYVERFLASDRAPSMTPPTRVAGPPSQPGAPQAPAGVAFVPGRGVDISFDAPQDAGTLRLSTMPGSSVRITHRGGAAAYRLTADGVSVGNTGSSADFELVVPVSVSRVRVRVGTRTVFDKEGATIRTTASRDSAGVYVIPLHATSTQRSTP